MSQPINNNQAAKVHAQVLQAIQAPKESKGAQKATKTETKCVKVPHQQKELPAQAKGKKIKKVSQSDSSVQKPTVSKTDKVAKSIVNNINITNNNTTNITNNITVRKSGSDKKFDKLMKAFQGLMKAFAKPQVNIFFIGKPKHSITASYLPRYNKPAFHFHQSGLGLIFNKRA